MSSDHAYNGKAAVDGASETCLRPTSPTGIQHAAIRPRVQYGHLLNAAALLYVVRYLIARASPGLRAMWAVMATLNVTRVLEMSVLLARAECQRAERTATATERDLRSQ